MTESSADKGWVKAEVADLPTYLEDSAWFVPLDKIVVADYRRAIIVYWAPWSGPYASAFRLLMKKLAGSKIPLQLLFISWDHGTDPRVGILMELFGEIVGGWCETCWVRDGKIIGQNVFGNLALGGSREDIEKQMDQRIAQML